MHMFGPMFIGVILFWIVLFLIFSALLMWLWNITITPIFGIRVITFWEAFRLMIIAALLFGGGSGFDLNFDGF